MSLYRPFLGVLSLVVSFLFSSVALAQAPITPLSSASSSSEQSSASSQTSEQSFHCEVTSESVWNNGFVYSFEITNTGIEPIGGWEVILDLPEGYTIHNAWGADISGSAPEYLATSKSWNGLIAENPVGFGIQGTHSGTADEQPRCFAVGQNPTAELRATMNGQTVFLDALGFIQSVSQPESVTVDWGDGHSVYGAHEAWHTYFFEGTYTITVSVASDTGISRKTIEVEAGQWQEQGNHPPVAMIASDHSPGEVWAETGLSMDPDGGELTKIIYSANSGFTSASASSSSSSLEQAFSSSSRMASSISSHAVTNSSSSSDSSRFSNSSSSFESESFNKVLTVFDGELGDTSQASGYSFNGHLDFPGIPRPLLRKRGLTLYVNAGYSSRTNALRWDFGDGADSNDTVTSHTYDEPGVYDVTLSTTGVFFVDDKTVSVSMGYDQAPSADFTCEAFEDLSVTCAPASDYDEDGDVLKFEWQLQGETDAITTSVYPSALLQVEEPGTYEVTLEVYDGTRRTEQTQTVSIP